MTSPRHPKTWDPSSELNDLHGKVAVVTGANSGVGHSTTKGLALRGAKIYLATRSQHRAVKAISSLRAAHPEIKENQLTWLHLDLSNLISITKSAGELKMKESKVHILVNNAAAGGAVSPTSGTDWEPHIAIDHVGHFLFTNQVLPLLKAAARDPGSDVRIVTVSSNVQKDLLPSSCEIEFRRPDVFQQPVLYYPAYWRYFARFLFTTDMIAYAHAKLANVHFTKGLQSKMDEQDVPIVVLSVNPGSVNTAAAQSIFPKWVWMLIRWRFLTPDEGAKNSLFAAAAEVIRRRSEKYKASHLDPVGIVTRPHPSAEDAQQVQSLWKNTENAINAYLESRGNGGLLPW